jgi:riboflavin kinase/FMN adenylyltransferase
MMKVHTDTAHLPAFRHAVVTIGTFDGVHGGHRQIIRQLRETATATGGESVIVTFHPHPRVVVGRTHRIELLTTLPERIVLLDGEGVDHLVVIPFTEAFASLEAKEYVEQFLVGLFHPSVLIIGYDHRFGKGRQGDYRLLEELSGKYGYIVKEIPEHVMDAAAVSSTRIREAMKSGNVAQANAGLGYPYFFEGTVVKGDQRGRTLGFPTANLMLNDTEKLVPANGVYAVTASLFGPDADGLLLKGMMNIGVRPTVDGQHRSIEVNLFDFDHDIYGKTLKVELRHHLRLERKFGSLDELKQQLDADRKRSLELLGN